MNWIDFTVFGRSRYRRQEKNLYCKFSVSRKNQIIIGKLYGWGTENRWKSANFIFVLKKFFVNFRHLTQTDMKKFQDKLQIRYLLSQISEYDYTKIFVHKKLGDFSWFPSDFDFAKTNRCQYKFFFFTNDYSNWKMNEFLIHNFINYFCTL